MMMSSSCNDYSRRERLVAGLCLATIGAASLFSWNAIITASGFYRGRLCGTFLDGCFESVFSCTYQFTSLCGNVYATRQTEEASAERRIVPRLRMLATLFTMFTVLAANPKTPDSIFVPLTVSGVALCGWLSQALCAALYGVAAALPSSFMSWCMSGQALGGLIPAAVVVFSAVATHSEDSTRSDKCSHQVDPAAVGYFATAASLFAFSLLAFKTLQTTRVFRDGVDDAPKRDDDDTAVAALVRQQAAEPPADFQEMKHIARLVSVPAAAVFTVFAVTLSAFPALTAIARPYGHADDDDGSGSLFRQLFVPLLFLEYNLADFAGRSIAPLFSTDVVAPNVLLALSLARIVFIPMMMLGELSTGSNNSPEIFRRSSTPFLLMLPFGLTTGLYATLAMTSGPPLVSHNHRQLAGSILAFFLTLGLVLGSSLSFAVLYLAENVL